MNNTIFELKNVNKEYKTKVEIIEVLKEYKFRIESRRFHFDTREIWEWKNNAVKYNWITRYSQQVVKLNLITRL
jgi:hypothetical protein